jgi:signal transduction histidine kinase
MTTNLRESTFKLEKTNKKLEKVNQELIEKGEELVHAAKMVSIGQLAGGVAHEINNPLMSMLGWAQLGQEIIEKEEKKAIPVDQGYLKTLKRYFKTIEEGARRCQVVTESLLKISRQMDISETQLVDINQVIEDTFTVLQYQTRLKNIEIKRDFSPSLPKVNVNLGQMQQVFFDLISNAALAMPQGGELSISTVFSDDKFIDIEIADTGCGISRENLDKIFNPFFTTRETGKGMGLGLSVAYGIIKQQGGTIKVESKEGIGTTFTIRLPATQC